MGLNKAKDRLLLRFLILELQLIIPPFSIKKTEAETCEL